MSLLLLIVRGNRNVGAPHLGPKAVPPGPQPNVYPETTPHAAGDPTFRFKPSTRMWELREPAYPAVSTTLPGNWCSIFTLYCCTRPCLKLRFCDCSVPGKD